jgi:hypothetical protein
MVLGWKCGREMGEFRAPIYGEVRDVVGSAKSVIIHPLARFAASQFTYWPQPLSSQERHNAPIGRKTPLVAKERYQTKRAITRRSISAASRCSISATPL